MAINYAEKDNIDLKDKFPTESLLHFPNFAERKFLRNQLKVVGLGDLY